MTTPPKARTRARKVTTWDAFMFVRLGDDFRDRNLYTTRAEAEQFYRPGWHLVEVRIVPLPKRTRARKIEKFLTTREMALKRAGERIDRFRIRPDLMIWSDVLFVLSELHTAIEATVPLPKRARRRGWG